MATIETIGRYKIEREIAKGGTAYVFLAQDPQLKRQVAIKLLDEEFTDDQLFRTRFQREAEVIASLEHPHIVPIYDIGEENDQLFIVMRYMTGGSLASKYRGNPVPSSDILRIFRRMASALEEAHNHGIVHRDIKPGNILFDRWGDSYLSDFGIVKLIDTVENLSDRSLVGTPAYLSPEQAQGITEVTPQSDIYSLGVLLFQMLTGRLPFWSTDPFELITLHISEPTPSLLEFNPECKPGYQAIINRAMAKNPEQRYTSPNAMVHAIESLFSPSDTLDLPIDEVYPHKSNRKGALPPTNLQRSDEVTIGRDAEINELNEFLVSNLQRVLTIIGPGGVGKTHLANHVALENLKHFSDGVYLISLSPSHSPDQIPQLIASAIGLPIYDPSDPLIQLINYLKERKILLVIDNFDTFTEYVTIIRKLIEDTDYLKIIITSRQNLQEKFGTILKLKGLSYPEEHISIAIEDYESIKLFIIRAKKVQSSFELTSVNKRYIADICKLLNGIPLAIELAASWTRLLSPREISREIRNSTDFLVSTEASHPDRHQSLKAIFEQSWRLLEQDERSALSKLSIFQNKFSREAATQVTEVPIQVLYRLVDKSLLQVIDGDFNIYGVIRRYAARKYQEQFNTTVLLRQNYIRYYVSLVEEQHQNLLGENQKVAIETFISEIDNISTAWLWSIKDQIFIKLTLFIDALYNFYEIIGWINDGKSLFRQGLKGLIEGESNSPEYTGVLNLVRAKLGAFCYRTGDYEEGIEYLNLSLKNLPPDTSSNERAFILTYLGAIFFQKGDFDQAENLLSESVRLYDNLDDSRGKAIALHHNALLKHTQGEKARAISLHKRSLSISESINNQFGISISLNHIGVISLELGEFLEADINLRESLRIRENLKDIWGIARSHVGLGQLALQRGKIVSAEKHLDQALEIFEQISDSRGIATALINMAKIMEQKREYLQAKSLLARAIHLSVSIQAIPIALEALVNYANILNHLNDYNASIQCLIFTFSHQATSSDIRRWAIKLYNQIKDQMTSNELSDIQSEILTMSIEELADRVTGDFPTKETI